MYETKPYFYGTGRRKNSVARVRVYNGTGKITINDRDIDDYFGLETLKLIVRQPLAVAAVEGKFDIVVRVSGGGVSGQAGAIRHGLSRALLVYDGAQMPVVVKGAGRDYASVTSIEKGRFPHARSAHEGTQEVRPQGGPPRSPVQQALISTSNWFKNAQKPRKTAVFRGFSISHLLLQLV